MKLYLEDHSYKKELLRIVADSIFEKLDPHGVMVVIEAEHMCMTMRGVKKPGSKTLTTATRGVFVEDHTLRSEVLSLIKE